MRINKLFSNFGICSRKETNKIIREGRVIVNGKPCIEGQWVELSDEILLDGKPLVPKKKIYIALNKPVGVVCTAAEEVKNNIIDYLGIDDYVFPIGRLDKDSQGLIILTNDGDLANEVLAAENNHEKEYIVTLDQPFYDDFIEKMEQGVEILGQITKPCKVKRINENTYSIILTQGLNRQIRRMSKVFGFNVVKLERIRILNITIDDIEYGKWRYINRKEIEILKKLIK
ncbi:pseudouridine synthase [Clostridium perfringens]|uniref:pseudouridine synthase n=1 Tax=Clostridium perfringens TaxID=1502 RepID=UPI002979D8B8|nr:pseudouridine synthase [Clostridium perfringens]MDM0465287.1 pseudouridine synthase [Clostridium perfringens]MDM0472320.1 pseudouridine synthase [Clostridium perfringens]MDM0476484.1 pseudouridine synthase [Clostridium perfringens]MDM0480208.1 pseudouridine synthase [Clostridium perfringens]